MSPLSVEFYNPQKEEWSKAGQLNPGDPLGSISHNLPDGRREVYLFQCDPGNEESVVYRSKAGVDIDIATSRLKTRIVETIGVEEVARLTDGQSHVISVRTDISDSQQKVRFTHQK